MAPDPNDTIDFEWIRMKIAEGYVPAMHGCNHVYTTDDAGIFPLNPFSEFAGVSLYDQLKLIGYGKKLLRNKGIDTDVFMAPGHSYDINTLKALKHFGFKYVTDGFGRRPYTQGGLTFLPISLLRSLELKDPEDGVTTFVVHTWMMDDPDFEEYEKLFSEHRERFINFDELFKITPVRRSRGKHYAEYTAARLKRFAGSIKK